MVRLQGVMDIIMLQQDARGSGIFRQHEVNFPQDTDGTERHVLHIAHWGWNDIQYAHNEGKYNSIYQNRQKKR